MRFYHLLLCLLGFSSVFACKDRIQIAQESGKIMIDYKYYPMKDVKSSELIRCAPTGIRSPYYFANECSFKMNNCDSFVISNILDPQVCYFKTKLMDDLITPDDSWNETLDLCLGTYLNLK